MRRAFALAVLCLATAVSCAANGEREPLTILWTGETHAMLHPCDCPFRPEGGLARRASAVMAERAERAAVLLDAGGWAAGGLYDEYTEGPEIDALRTKAAARAMAAMAYQAVAISDEELLDGGLTLSRCIEKDKLPFVSANLFEKATGRQVAPSFRMLPERRLAVVGLTTTGLELLAPKAAERYEARPPVEAARRAVGEAREAGAEFVIVLSPLGEELSERIAREVEGIDLVVNGHRRLTSAPYFRAGGALVVQFDFQGRSIGRARVVREENGLRVTPVAPIRLGPEIPADRDPAVTEILRELEESIKANANRRRLAIELFKAALCPYAPRVERVVAEVARELGERVDVRVTQVVHVDARGELRASRGRAELEEARRQAAIFEFYPRTYWDYVAWRAENATDADWEAACRRLKISPARVRACVEFGEADEVLRRHAHRVKTLRATGSPALRLGGRRYEGGHRRLEILRAVCSSLPGGSKGVSLCRGIPECFSDADCRRPGFAAECVDAGTKRARCVHHRAVQVELTVVEDGEAVYSPVARILDALRVFFPGLAERRTDFRSPEGASLVARYKIDRLPAYILGREALTERKIDPIREALVPVEDRLVLAPRLVGSHQDITRPRRPGRVDLFLAPHANTAAEGLEEVLDLAERGEAPRVNLRAAVYRDADWKPVTQGGLGELETMLREIAVAERWPGKLPAYLRERLKRVGSSYWIDALGGAGLDPAEVRRTSEGDWVRAILEADAQALAELGAGGAVVLLVSNQELVQVASRAELRHVLAAARELARRTAASPSAGHAAGADAPLFLRSARAREAVPLLVRALAAAPEHARPGLGRHLSALTGEHFGEDAARWRRWARAKGLEP